MGQCRACCNSIDTTVSSSFLLGAITHLDARLFPKQLSKQFFTCNVSCSLGMLNVVNGGRGLVHAAQLGACAKAPDNDKACRFLLCYLTVYAERAS